MRQFGLNFIGRGWAVFARIFVEFAQPRAEGEAIMIASKHIKAHRAAAI